MLIRKLNCDSVNNIPGNAMFFFFSQEPATVLILKYILGLGLTVDGHEKSPDTVADG